MSVSSSEPEYTFIKGQGWVLGGWETLSFTSGKGENLTLIARKPDPGEKGIYCGPGNEFYCTNGKPNLKGWVQYFQYVSYSSLKYLNDYMNNDYNGLAVWITVIKND